MTEVEMKVKGLTLDPLTNMPIVILKDLEGQRALPIWVGIFEANAIALEMEKVPTPRPMTHDLIKNILDGEEIINKYNFSYVKREFARSKYKKKYGDAINHIK